MLFQNYFFVLPAGGKPGSKQGDIDININIDGKNALGGGGIERKNATDNNAKANRQQEDLKAKGIKILKKRRPLPREEYERMAKACQEEDTKKDIDFLSLLRNASKNGEDDSKVLKDTNATYFEVSMSLVSVISTMTGLILFETAISIIQV